MNKSKKTANIIITICWLTTAVFPIFSQALNRVSKVAYADSEPLPPSSPDITNLIYLPNVVNIENNSWPMVAANPQRTSWTPEEVSGYLNVEWYRPVEAYISQNVQIIAADGKLFISTSKGLYVLNATNGAVVWRFDTELPLGNSPTVANGIVYVGGYDRKLHALDARTGSHLWEYAGAQAGYDTNPLIVDGKVIIGNRDGAMYAIGAHGAPNQGQLIWKYQTNGPIHISAAYKDGIIYFASSDNYAYALSIETGQLRWKSAKLPGDGYHSYWPVIYQDKLIISATHGYRIDLDPGTRSVVDENDTPYGTFTKLQIGELFQNEPLGTLLGPILPAQDWSNGYPIIDGSRLTQYFENNPSPSTTRHKPWRRTTIILNMANGSEYTFDFDGDGYAEYAPLLYWNTNSGNRYPPLIGKDNLLYQSNLYQYTGDSQGKVMGWKLGTPFLSLVGGQAAIVEPQAISSGGNLIYRSLCCDRVGSYFDIREDGLIPGTVWSYDLDTRAPTYDDMWTVLPGWPRLQGWYKGNSNSINGIYHNHGDQNPIIPYNDRLFVHRSNTIIAFGKSTPVGKLPLLAIQNTADPITPPTDVELKAKLETEVSKIIQAGHLRPGYYNNGQFAIYKEHADYFENPGDTLYTLSLAYPYLSTPLQTQLKDYLRREFLDYFDPIMYSTIGWADGAPREWMPLPPEPQSVLALFPKKVTSGGFSWSYPPHNFYALWKYAQIELADAPRIYDLAKSKLVVPVPSIATVDYFYEKPYEVNAYIAGYIGFLNLQELAGRTVQDSVLRTNITNELNRLYLLRVTNFEKDTPYLDDIYHKRSLNIARNFMMLTPELGNYLNQNAISKMFEAINEYEYIAPYWFVSRYESMMNEGTMSPLYNYSALFQAKAYILKESRAELARYLDVPAFERGDLFYIQNIVATLQAQ